MTQSYGQNELMTLGQNDLTNTNEYTMITNNDIKKRKTEIDLIIDEYNFNKELKDMIYEFIKMRKTIKRPMTTIAVKRLINKLNNFTENENEKIKILEKSIFHSWQDIYELKQDEKETKQETDEERIARKTREMEERLKYDIE